MAADLISPEFRAAIIVLLIIYALAIIITFIVVVRKKEQHPLARASFILSTLCLVPAINYVALPLAILLGVSALKDIKVHPQPGRNLAVAGVCLGSVAFAIALFGALVFYFRTVQ
ncbi:DUF4190 domain-containing protein [Candidatus Woesearchaeota archaeon]|nr:DUF4190 domain-containing protein [Candidatus Woesearchaeota archaeon]